MFTGLSLAGTCTYTVFFFLALEEDKSESKNFNKVLAPENSTWNNYLSDKLHSYALYALCCC